MGKKKAKVAKVTEIGKNTVNNLKNAVKNIEKEIGIKSAAKEVEDKTLKATAERGIIESDDDWFENWKPEDQDVIKAEDAYLKTIAKFIEAGREKAKARKVLVDLYDKYNLDAEHL
ncbi:MAG: hypothetical protein ACXABY_28705 [Candidatus Thorarchaeota archaeon]|jgi:hypothetical protein